MKSFRNSLFLLALTSLPLTGADLFAQSADDAMRLGYCTTEYSSGLILQDKEGPGVYQAAVYFTSDLLNKYEGDKIQPLSSLSSRNVAPRQRCLYAITLII